MLGHLKIWAAILVLLLLAAPFIASEKRLQEAAGKELALMQSALGLKETNVIVTKTNAIYDWAFIQTGLLGELRKKTTYENDRMSAGSNLGSAFYHFTTAMNNYLLGVITLAYISILRVIMISTWLPFLLPFIVAAIIDGVVHHKILHSSVAVSNPVKFKIATNLLVVGVALPILYLFSPFAISPLFILAWTALMALPLMMVIAGLSPLSYQ